MEIGPVLLDLDDREYIGVDTAELVNRGCGCGWAFSVPSSLPWVTVDVESEFGPMVDELEPVEETIDCDIESCSEAYESVWAGTYSVVTPLLGLETSGGLKLDELELPFILRPVRSLPRSRPGWRLIDLDSRPEDCPPMPIVEPHGEMLPIGDSPLLLDLEFECSLSENEEFLVDDLPRDSDLESEDLVWDIEGLVVEPLTEFRQDDEEDLPRKTESGANNLLSTLDI